MYSETRSPSTFKKNPNPASNEVKHVLSMYKKGCMDFSKNSSYYYRCFITVG